VLRALAVVPSPASAD